MLLQNSLQIANSCIDTILSNFQIQLLSKAMQTVAQKQTAKAFTQLGKQFINLIGSNNTFNHIKQQHQPIKIGIDESSCYQINVQRELSDSIMMMKTQKSTKDRSSSNYTKLTTSAKQYPKSSQKGLIKLDDDRPELVLNEFQDRLRNIYVAKLKTKLKQQKQRENSLVKSSKIRQLSNDFIRNKEYFTYGYDGKILRGKSRSLTSSIAPSLRTEVSRSVHFTKRLKMNKPQPEVINSSLCESSYFKSRKLSIQFRQQKLYQDLSIRQTPMFLIAECSDKDKPYQLKLQQFKTMCKRNKSKQFNFFRQNRKSFELPSINKTVSVQNKSMRQSLNTQVLISSTVLANNKMRKLKYLSQDSIKINPQLFESFLNQQ